MISRKLSRIFGTIMMIAGAALLIAAALLIFRYHVEKQKNTVDTAAICEKIESILPERTAGVIEEREDTEMPALELDGRDYAGILELSSLSVKLPVAASWEEQDTAYRPAVFTGSAYDGSLVVGGRYESGNFDFVDSLNTGETVTFTDMTGTYFSYTVTRITHTKQVDQDTIRDDAEENGDDLTLFVKKSGTFLVVHCKI